MSGQCDALPPLPLGRSPIAYWGGGWVASGLVWTDMEKRKSIL